MIDIDKLVNRFLSWKLPSTVSADLISTVPTPENIELRSGTNLLTADEARQMFEYVLAEELPHPGQIANADDPITMAILDDPNWLLHKGPMPPNNLHHSDMVDVLTTSGALLKNRKASQVKWTYVTNYRLSIN
jgi:hypothetical protein